ncbi:hypothetical protein [Janthinobacterium sp. CAN_S7]|uniref:hypothetical protein n=1 Tax=Janthinobacterium sp. CAN_S7 TaxID=3071704 RepID=UPI00319DF457
MEAVTFKNREVPKIGTVFDVYLGKSKTGTIYRVVGGYQYQISKKQLGEVLPSLQAVKNTLIGQ